MQKGTIFQPSLKPTSKRKRGRTRVNGYPVLPVGVSSPLPLLFAPFLPCRSPQNLSPAVLSQRRGFFLFAGALRVRRTTQKAYYSRLPKAIETIGNMSFACRRRPARTATSGAGFLCSCKRIRHPCKKVFPAVASRPLTTGRFATYF